MQHTNEILIVDDVTAVADMLAEVLVQAGYDARTINDGPSALVEIAECRPALVLLDQSLPDRSGFEMFQLMRRHGLTDVPIVLMTRSTQAARSFIAQGVTSCLVKPILVPDLLACAARHATPRQANAVLPPLYPLIPPVLRAA